VIIPTTKKGSTKRLHIKQIWVISVYLKLKENNNQVQYNELIIKTR